jgi:transposase-like protein
MAPVEAPRGERSEPGGAGTGAIRAAPSPPDPEVAAKATRRTFTAEYKLRILEQVERAGPGGTGEILRREGLYSSHLTAWRKAVRQGALRRLGRKRGRKPLPVNPLTKKVERLERELSRTRDQLRKAELILEVQGKVAGLLGFRLEDGRSS